MSVFDAGLCKTNNTARGRSLVLLLAALFSPALLAFALDGQVQIHDPSAVVLCDGRFYCFGSGGIALVSDDGWTWRRGNMPGQIETAPDVFQTSDRFCIYFAANVGAQSRAAINMIWSKTLDTNSADYKWEDGGAVVSSDGLENNSVMGPGIFHDPNDGRFWLTYGSRSGHIRLVELDFKTGKRLNPGDAPVNIAMNCDAAEMIYHDGWYYLFANHGFCCAGANSTYNIRVGRSKKGEGAVP